MTTFTFEVLVTLKPGLADPQGKAVEASLPSIGFTGVSRVQVGRHVRLDVEAPNEADARTRVDEIARRLLSNPVIEDYRVLERRPERRKGSEQRMSGRGLDLER